MKPPSPTRREAVQEPELWTLTFRPLPGDVPVPVRIRHLLKYGLRALKLRCVWLDTNRPRRANK